MTKPVQVFVVKHLKKNELSNRIKHFEKSVLILQRLIFIKHRYEGMSVPEAAQMVNVSKNTGYLWQKSWNEDGYDGIIPNFGGGRPSKLTDEQKIILRDMLKLRDNWNTKEVKEFILKNFNVKYSLKQIRKILNELNIDYKKSDNEVASTEDERKTETLRQKIEISPDFPWMY
jgi:putative transposase